MKKQLVLHPFLFAIYPLLELFYKLSPNVVFRDTLRALGLVLLLSVGLFLGIGMRTKQWSRAGFFTTLILFVLLFYGSVYRVAWNLSLFGVHVSYHAILFPLWTSVILFVGVGLGTPRIWQRFQGDVLVTGFLNTMVIIALVVSLGRYLLRLSAIKEVDFQTAESVVANYDEYTLLEPAVLPDIYYVILDGYARQDVLQQLYGLDNSGFVAAMHDRGFYIAQNSHSNYVQTVLSLASSLNFSYLSDLPVDSADRLFLVPLIWNSAARNLLDELGYRFVASNSGYPFTSIANAEVFFNLADDGPFNIYEEMVLMGTSAVILIDNDILPLYNTGYAVHRRHVTLSFDSLRSISALPGPKFVMFHIVSPHPPFVIDRDGNAVSIAAPFEGGRDGSYFPGSTAEYVSGYVEKLLYTNKQLLQGVDAILEDSSTPPIIIFQADHGPGAWLEWDSAEKTCLVERTAIFNAYYLPGAGVENLYPDITPVNTFRVIFNTYFGTDLPLLEDKTYFSSWDYPFDFIEVTDRLAHPCDMH